MRRQVGIGEGTRAAAGARRRAESGGRADTAGRGGQVGKRGGRLREVGQHPRPMQAAGAVSSVVCRLSSRRDRLCTLDCAVLWCALAGGRVVDTGLATSVRTRGANVTAKRCWRLSRTRGTWGGAEGGDGRRRRMWFCEGGEVVAVSRRDGNEVLLLLQWTASSGSSRFWANEQTAGR